MPPEKLFNFDLKDKQYHLPQLDAVHIWCLFLPSQKGNMNYLRSILSKDEKTKAYSFKFAKDQEQYLITRGALRCILACYLQKTPESIGINYGEWGKPCLQEPKVLQFNVSHSGNYSLLAFTKKYEIGIDLELINHSFEVEEIAKTIFSSTELLYWSQSVPEKKVDIFYKIWVGREAFLKAIGKGWLEESKKINEEDLFSYKDHIFPDIYKNNLGFLQHFECIDGYKSALFTKGPVLKPTFINC